MAGVYWSHQLVKGDCGTQKLRFSVRMALVIVITTDYREEGQEEKEGYKLRGFCSNLGES